MFVMNSRAVPGAGKPTFLFTSSIVERFASRGWAASGIPVKPW